MKKLKLRRWVKVVLITLFIFDFFLITYDIMTHKTVINEIGKHYTCYGSIIRVCHGENYEL